MPWPFRRRNEPTAEAAPAAVVVAPAPATATAAPEPPRYARAAPGAWKKLGAELLVTAPPPRTAALEVFTASLATRQSIVHVSSVPKRSEEAPAGAVLAVPFDLPARRAQAQRQMPPADVPALDVPRTLRRARATTTPLPSFALDELPPLPPVKLVPLPQPVPQAYEFDLDELGPDGVLESWSLAEHAPEDVREQFGLVEVLPAEPPPETPRPHRGRPNLGQSRRLGLGNAVQLPEDYIQRLRAGQQLPLPPDEAMGDDAWPEEQVEEVPEDLRQMVLDAHGVDVGDVPIVRGPEASEEARALGARAFARDEVVFLPDDAGPLDHPEARSLAAHELVHIAQQRQLGTSLPDESSDAGLELEADARLAEAHVRGDAPRPGSSEAERLEVVKPLLAGVARLDGDGNLVYTPGHRAASGVQRAVDYRWQRKAMVETGVIDSPSAIRSFFSNIGSYPETDDELLVFNFRQEQDAARFEEEHKDRLVGYRQQKRADKLSESSRSLGQRENQTRRGLSNRGVPRLSAEPEDGEVEEADLAYKDRLQALKVMRSEYEIIFNQWKAQADAIDQIEKQYPMRDMFADRPPYPEEPEFDLDAFMELRESAREAGARVVSLRQAQNGRGDEEGPLVHASRPRSGAQGESAVERISGDREADLDAMVDKVKSDLSEVDTYIATKKESQTRATDVVGSALKSASARSTSWQQDVAQEAAARADRAAASRGGVGGFLADLRGGAGAENLAEMSPERRKQWEADNIGLLAERRHRLFNEYADAASDAVARSLIIKEGKDIRNLPQDEKWAYLSADDWEQIINKVASEAGLIDEKRHPLVDLIPATTLARRRAMERGDTEGKAAEEESQPAVVPRADAQPQAPAAVPPGRDLAAASTTHAQGTALLDLNDLEHDQLDVLSRRLWFFMRSRIRNELLVDRERAGMLSDFIR